MKNKFHVIWGLTLQYIKKIKKKDYVIHTKGVIRAMELLLKEEKEDENILIPAAMLHDVGWSKVPLNLQLSTNKAKKKKAAKLHLKYAPPIVKEVLATVAYTPKQIKHVTEIILSHKFKNPRRKDKQLLIDADNLCDAFKTQFYSDLHSYKTTPEKHYEFRKNNWFYTKTAKRIFDKELEKRKMEFIV